MDASNQLEELFKANNMERMTPSWRALSAFIIEDFPKLPLDDLHHTTLGLYQVKIGQNYSWIRYIRSGSVRSAIIGYLSYCKVGSRNLGTYIKSVKSHYN